MSYQRWGKPGRAYVWMGKDGLHIWPDDGNAVDPTQTELFLPSNVVGRDNADAILRGCFDLLEQQGMTVRIRKGKCVIERRAP